MHIERPALHDLVVADLDPVHLIGIGGAGMSAIAKVLLMRGIGVSGSDMKDSAGLAALRALGATTVVGHDAGNLGDVGAVVVSSAIREANPELRAARERGIPVLHRAQVLALLMRERRGIAVAGTHGKTTTSSMVALVLQRAGIDPSFLIGGDLNERGTNAHSGDGDWLVAEADESDGSFLWLAPELAILTNVEADHLDHYADEAEVRETFLAFTHNVAPDGCVVACGDDAGVRAIAARIERRVVTYGLTNGRWTAERAPDVDGQRLRVLRDGVFAGDVLLRVAGEHNARNALAAIAIADLVGISFDRAASALSSFAGVQRRFQDRGSAAGVRVVDDYAHHPTEVAATLSAAREARPRRIIAVFQPHLYSRTAFFGHALGAALSRADLVVVTDVYGAREDPQPGITGKLVVEGVIDTRPRALVAYVPKRGDIPRYVAGRARAGDLVLTIGAGDVTMLGDEILAAITARGGARA